MIAFGKTMHDFEERFEDRAENFTEIHPFIASAVIFICMPVLLTGAVTVFASAVAVPMSFICGWM